MKNQTNDMVTLEWLLPLLNQQLSQLSGGWQGTLMPSDTEPMAEQYHQISGVLVMANLPQLSGLAAKLSLLSSVDAIDPVDEAIRRQAQLAHQLLAHELEQYVQTGRYRSAVIAKTIISLTQAAAQLIEQLPLEQQTTLRQYISTEGELKGNDAIKQDVQIEIPSITTAAPLQKKQYEQILAIWRQQTQSLLSTDSNDPRALGMLRKASHYLWQTMQVAVQQRLWYIVEMWLSNLAQNNHPLPTKYEHILTHLEQIIVSYVQQFEQADSEQLSPDMIESLIVDIYIHLSGLTHIDEQAQTLLSHLPQTADATLRFLPRILSELEAIIFSLEDADSLIEPLEQVQRQLDIRGWKLYQSQVEQVLEDVKQSADSEAVFAQMKWQIERQLQELYSAIYQTEQAIRTKIGAATTFAAQDNQDQTTNTEKAEAPTNDEALRELRIAVENVKHHFNDYIQRQQIYLLPNADAFFEIGSAFEEMGLPTAKDTVAKLSTLFAKIIDHNINTLGWNLTQSLAEGLSAIELLLDHLAQQVFDAPLLAKADAHIDKAAQLLEGLIDNPADAMQEGNSYAAPTHRSSSVPRYDDTGEIMPTIGSQDSDQVDNNSGDLGNNDNTADSYTDDTETTQEQEVSVEDADSTSDDVDEASANSNNVSELLLEARGKLKPDNFETDDEIREIFTEEAEEVVETLEEFLPAWHQNPQDLTPLTEVRRGFHTLKGSGRMVGAFSISEMAWAIENLLNRVLDKTLPVTNDVVKLVLQTMAYIPTLVSDFTAQNEPSIDPAIIILHSDNILAGRDFDDGVTVMPEAEAEALAADSMHDDLQYQDQPVTDLEIVADGDSADSGRDASTSAPVTTSDVGDIDIPEVLVPFMEAAAELPSDSQDADPDIKEIFIEEAEEVLEEIVPLYEQWRSSPESLELLSDVRRGFHTLKGSGRMVGANHTAELAWSIENMLNRLLDRSVPVSADIVVLVGDVLAAYPDLVTVFAEGREDYPEVMSLWVACAQAYSKQLGDDFDYPTLYVQWTGDNESISTSESISTFAPVSDSESTAEVFDSTLETMNSVNDIIAEAPVMPTSQSAEEQEFCNIFVEEAQALLDSINDFVRDNQHRSEVEVNDEIVRAFHTLRGASGSSALLAISDVSGTIEKSLEHLQQNDTAMNAQHLQALKQSVTLIENHLLAYENSVQHQVPLDDMDVQNEQDLASLQVMLDDPDYLSDSSSSHLDVAMLLDTDIDALLDGEWELGTALSTPDLEEIRRYAQSQLEQITRLKTQTVDSSKFSLILGALEATYRLLETAPSAAHDNVLQSLLIDGHKQLVGLFDALAGSMSLKIDRQVVVDLQEWMVQYTENMPTDISDDPVDEALVDEEAPVSVDEPVEEIEVAASDMPVAPVTSTQAAELQIEHIETDIELLEIFLEEAQELDNAITQSFNKWRADIYNVATLKILQRHLHTIKGGARMAGISSIGDLTHEAESIYEAFVEERFVPTAQWLTIMQTVQDTLSLQIDHVIRYQESFFANELIEQLQAFIKADSLPESVTLILPALQGQADTEQVSSSSESDKGGDTSLPSIESLVQQSWTDGLPDPDILEVFLDEADELIASSNKYLQLFLSNISDTVALQALQRDLHTIKGGARMVGATGIADLSHQMETVYEELAIRRRPATKKISQLLVTCHDWLADAIFILKHTVNAPMPTALISALQQFVKNPDSLKQIPVQSLQSQLNVILANVTKQSAVRRVEDISKMPSMDGSFATQEQSSSSSNEMIRISSNLIEHMINLSGESAINRARIDMGMSSLTNSIEEMGTTVQRLADQLRRMEIELEAQILSQIDDEELMQNEGFDPLEMDQYSSLNQLSKSLTESASDLIDINSTLLEKTRDSENLLLQLSRTQAELQDGLMNSRMVPFARLTPRLERIVRQTANELNKSVELSIINADDEMDRTILERITSPLEHMLRNAVDHGIETAQERINAGKDRSGHIRLEVLREGSEVVIHLTDDGRGINVDAVRAKAISQGLIEANDNLSDIEVMQYIFNAGLSTTKQVTQISGRGVGMDVVISEIRQLGGVVSVSSERGQGSRFTMRVPLTVAISDALVVRAADRYYAIPLVQIERVVRINPEELYNYYRSGRATMNIEDANYRVRYLNEILTGSKLNELIVNTNSSLPVIIVKNRAGQNLALQVDQIAGSRIEVVVKPLGRQLSHLEGISAATIMGDGSVMLILDLIALLRNAPMLKDVSQGNIVESQSNDRQTTVLVVDDSVTVRKVTSRFLERQGIKAMVAKDGIDAIEILQETIPDLILLDIEMPRMDGFEVASQIRHNGRLQDIPIIMITSRTGEKHRERAFELGVNEYMGKPFQENQLLDNIQNLLGIEISATHDG